MLFVPRELRVGYQNRGGTYTGKLAYVVYVDDKGVVRKENSWQTWRDKKIEPDTFENVPTSGFVLNKQAGGRAGSWGHDIRRTTVRVYDPRGFEIEVCVANLLYILENTNSIKGKGLEGEFVYGWDGTELLLIPTEAPDYQAMINYRDSLYDKSMIKNADLVVGYTYLSKDNETLVYMGKFMNYQGYGEPAKCHTFMRIDVDRSADESIIGKRTINTNGYIIKCLDDNPYPEFADLFDKMESSYYYSPIDRDRIEYEPWTFEEFEEALDSQKNWPRLNFYSGDRRCTVYHYVDRGENYRVEVPVDKPANHIGYYWSHSDVTSHDTLREVFNKFKPQAKLIYLRNGKFYRKEK